MGGGEGGAAPGRSSRRLLASQPLWQRSEKRGKKAAREPPAHAGLCPGDTGQLLDNPSVGWEHWSPRQSAWQRPGHGICHPRPCRAPHTLAGRSCPCAMSSVHPILRAGRSFPAQGRCSRGCPCVRPGHRHHPVCGHASWYPVSADLLGMPAIPRAAIVGFCSLFISPGWCHRWAIVPADSLKGKGTRLNFLLFN